MSSLVGAMFLAGCSDGGSTVVASKVAGQADLSGSVIVKKYAGIDKDVERTFNQALELKNNTAEEAQFITNPVALGGYLSGARGNFSGSDTEYDPEDLSDVPDYFVDAADYFQVALVENQALGFSAFYADSQDFIDAKTIDITLNLLDASEDDYGAVLATLLVGEQGTRNLAVPQTGDYIIEILAEDEGENVSSPVLYTLSLSQSLSQAEALGEMQARAVYRPTNPDLMREFVPGEVLVKYKDQTGRAGAQAARQSRSLTTTGMRFKRSVGAVAKLYEFDAPSLAASLAFDSANGLSSRQQAKWQTLEKIAELKRDSSVAYAEPNYLMRATSINDSEYARQWNMPMIKAPAAWTVATGQGVTVAVVDTGMHSDHEDLLNNISSDGYDFVSSADLDGDGVSGRDSNPFDPGSTYHGSHVSGIIAASANTVGVRGVAFDTEIIPLRALGAAGVGAISDIADAILYAAGLQSAGGKRLPAPADVINLSLGSNDDSFTLRSAVANAVAAGSTVVAAAGNDSNSKAFYPAAYPKVIGVSSVNERRGRSGFSNFGTYVDVAAPGGTSFGSPLFDGFQDGILSTVYADAYTELVGTSMAAPHISGVIALMKELQPSLSTDDFLGMLNAGILTDNIDISGVSENNNRAYFGAGLINAAKAVDAAGGAVPDVLVVSPGELGFIDGNSRAELVLNNPGSGSLVIESLTPSKAYISVDNSDTDGNGLGTWTVEVNLTAVLGNIDSAEIEIAYRINGGSLEVETIPVFVSKAATTSATVGNLNIYLVKWEDIETAEESGDTLVDIYASVGGRLDSDLGAYRFDFTDIPNGLYALEASTDNDGDNIWFDRGEARGAYPLLSESQLIRVDGEALTDLNFEVGYQSFLDASTLIDGGQESLVTQPEKLLMKRAPSPIAAE